MTQGTFRRRSGRVIGLGRLVLATSFLFAIWVDPSQPTRYPDVAYGLLALYVTWAAALLGLTWWNWWLDFRSATTAHVVDIIVFGCVVYLTEGYTSPFYTFFAFILLSSAIRWSWRETAATATLVLLVFAGAGGAALALDAEALDLQRVLIRTAHLTVLSLLLIWFLMTRSSTFPGRNRQVLQMREQGSPAETCVRLAMERTGAGRVVLIWCLKEEPWVHVTELDSDAVRSVRFGPGVYGPLFSDQAADRPFLFDRSRERGLCRDPGSARLCAFRQTIDPAAAEEYGLDQGLVIRVRSDAYEGELFALDMEGLSADDLGPAETLGEELSKIFERITVAEIIAEAEVSRARASLARDIHDSVVQVLAGASFRLEALKSWIRAGKAPDPEIDAIKRDLAEEQANVRGYVSALRSGRDSLRITDLGGRIGELAERLEQRWNILCEPAVAPGVAAPIWMEHEIHQIIREAAANAARHGQATRLEIGLRLDGAMIELSIADNGSGFGIERGDHRELPQPAAPWSVNERVKSLGGTLALRSSSKGSQLEIRLPQGKDS
jgi:signal transduction histidine kinase